MPQTKDTHDAKPWRLLLLLIAMTAIGPMTLNIVLPALPGMAARLATDPATVQLTISLYLLSLACAQLVLGPLSDRFGRRPVVIAGLALCVLASIGAVAASSIGALIAARIIQAAGSSSGIVIGRAIIRDLYDRDRSAGMIGLVSTAMVVAPMLAPLIGGILDTAFGWEAIFLFVTLMSGAVLLWAMLLLPETRKIAPASSSAAQSREWTGLFVSAKFYAYVLAAALGSAPFFIFIGGAPHVVITIMGRSSAEYGVWFALMAIGYMAGNFTVSRLAQRFKIDTMIFAGIAFELAGTAITIILIATMPNGGPEILFVPQFITFYGNGLLLPTSIAGAVSIRPQASGAASGLIGFVQMTFGAISAQVISVLLAGASNAMPIGWMMLALTVATAVAFWGLVRRP